MKKMMMAALFAATAAAAFGWLPENCMIRDRLCGEDASGRLCGKFDISCTERLFDIMRTNTAEIVRIENALYPAPKYDRIMPMEGETKEVCGGLSPKSPKFDSKAKMEEMAKGLADKLSGDYNPPVASTVSSNDLKVVVFDADFKRKM